MAGDTRRAFERYFPHDIHHRGDQRRSSHSRFPFHCHRFGDTGPQARGGRLCSFDHGAERASISGRSVQPFADKQEFEFAGDSRRRIRAATRDRRRSDPGMASAWRRPRSESRPPVRVDCRETIPVYLLARIFFPAAGLDFDVEEPGLTTLMTRGATGEPRPVHASHPAPATKLPLFP
jgi:hypothetical protein